MRHLKTVLLGGIAAMVLEVGSASATPVFDAISTCTTTNCQSVRIPGNVFDFRDNNALPWVIQVFANAGRCLRLDVTDQTVDLELVVVAPNGSVFRNDDRTASDIRPLVKVNDTPNSGWYTVQLAVFNGSPFEGDFVLRYGQYNLNNNNCSSPTEPTAEDLQEPLKAEPEEMPAMPDAPGAE